MISISKAASEVIWKALLETCAGDPSKAKRIVMLSKDDFMKAMQKVEKNG